MKNAACRARGAEMRSASEVCGYGTTIQVGTIART